VNLATSLRALPDTTRTAVVDRFGDHTFAQVVADGARLADELAALGSVRRVVLLLPEDAAAISLMYASQALQISALYVAFHYGEERARSLLESVEAERLLTVAGGHVVELARRAAPASPAGPDAEVLLLSSGTTGTPKCVRHTWAALAAAATTQASRADDRWLLAYPIAHFAGLQVVAQSLLSAASLVIPADLGAAEAIRAIGAGATCLSCTPTYFRRLVLTAPPSLWSACRLRQLTLGGEIADQAVLDAARRVLPTARILHIYASTEVGAAITVRDGLEGFDAALLDGTRFKVEAGQLLARRSERAMLGYLGADAPGEWFETGDLVEVTAGRARFRGRVTEVINVGGFKVHPAEVEAVVRQSVGVADAWVVGHASSITGQVVKAMICLVDGADFDEVTRDVRRRCAARLPAHMVPRLFQPVDRAELSPGQKLKRSPS
jgi:acyl-CoA synthetase (AMP-forming)/AMP-acid ligase II